MMKENYAKRVLALFLTVIMVLSSVPMVVFAQDTPTDPDSTVQEEQEPTIPEEPETPEESTPDDTPVDVQNVTSAEELEKAIATDAEAIRITDSFEIDRTFFITRDVRIYSEEACTLTRKADFADDIFVIGESAEGEVCPSKVILTVGTAGADESDLLTINGNSENMTVAVTGTVFFVCKNGQADLHKLNVTNCKKTGNVRALDKDKYTLCNDRTIIGGAVGIIVEAAKDDSSKITDGVMNIYGGKYTYNGVAESGTYGGVIFNHSKLNVYDGIFEHNYAERAGVFYNYRRMNMFKATVSDNSATAMGGAIYLPSSTGAVLYVDGGAKTEVAPIVFRNNSAKTAGAVSTSGTLVLRNALFEENKATSSAGAVYGSGSYNNITVYDCTFTKNESGESGGAICVVNKRESSDVALEVRDSLFAENKSTENGGAIYLSRPATAYIKNTAFSKNTSDVSGGAAYVLGSEAEFNDVSFTENKAGGSGGAVLMTNDSEVVKETDAEGNPVETTVNYPANVVMNKIIADKNRADTHGGFLYSGMGDLKMYNSSVTANTAVTGSAVRFYTSASADIYNCNFENNVCDEVTDGNAGAIFVYTGGTKVILHSCTIKNNTSSGFGGGILVSGKSKLDLYNITATGNKAFKGGFMYETAASTVVTVSGLTVSGNTVNDAENSGGPIIWGNTANAKLYINKSNYTDNDVTTELDDAYWAAAIYNKLTVYDSDAAVPAHDDYTKPEFDTDEPSRKGHTYTSVVTKEATCTETGNKNKTCPCGDVYDEELPALGHDEVPHDAKTPTCTEIGWDAYVTCTRCDYTTYSENAALGHDEIAHDAKEATCTAIGWDAYVTCTRCDYTTYNELPALGHDFTEEIINDAHLKQSGDAQSEYYYNCARENCDVISTEDTYTVLDSDVNKKFAEVSGITAGLTVNGTDTAKTEVINETEITLDFSKADASIGRYQDGWWAGINILAPEGITDEEIRNVKYRRYETDKWSADRSFWSYKDSKDDAARHYITVWVPVTPEYIEKDADGILTSRYLFDWDNNGFGISTQEIAIKLDVTKIKLIHSAGCTKVIEEEAVAPDCVNEGQNEKSYCSVCGLVLGDGKTLPALGHDEVPHDAKAPTCTEIGWDAYVTCTRCDYTTYSEKASLGHDEIAHDAKEATCTEIGWDAYITCIRCDYTTYSEKAALGHDEVTHDAKAPTCTEVGNDAYVTCTRCDYTTYNEIPVIEHSEVDVKGTAATCSKTGLTDGKKCSVCGTFTVAQQTIEKKAHTYTNSCDKSCNVCKATRSIKHTYKTYLKKATLSANGQDGKKCSVCGYITSTTKTVYYPKTFKLSATEYTYNKKTKTPTVTVKDSKGNTLKEGTDYTVSYESGRKLPGKYTVKITFKGKYEGVKRLYFTIKPRVTSKITASQTTTTITLKWTAVTGADGYRVYKYNSKTKKYEKLKDVTKNTLKISKLKAGTAYKYKVRAYTKDDGTIWGSYSDVFETATKPAKPTLKVTTDTKGTAKLSWSNVSGESGYQVYYSTKKDSGYKKVASYKTNVVKGSKSKLTDGKTYYFKVRSYKKTDSGTVYSDWSDVKSIKIVYSYYVTKTGSKYHVDGCSSLSKSKIKISYKNAVSKGYKACNKCIK